MEIQFQSIFDTKTPPSRILCDKLVFEIQDTKQIIVIKGFTSFRATEKNGQFHINGCTRGFISPSDSYAIQCGQVTPLTQMTESRLAHALLVASCADLALQDEEGHKASQVSAHIKFTDMQVNIVSPCVVFQRKLCEPLDKGSIFLYPINDSSLSKEDNVGHSPTILAIYHATPLLHYSIEETEPGNYELRAWDNPELSGYYTYHKPLHELLQTVESYHVILEETHRFMMNTYKQPIVENETEMDFE